MHRDGDASADLLWITWEDHRRSRSVAGILDAELHELTATFGRGRPSRYVINIIETIRIYRRRRPATVICQHPSFVLALLTVLLRRPFGYRVGLDTHNAGFAIDPWSPRYLRWLAVWLQRQADFVVAHNDAVRALVENRGGTVVVLPDPLPTIQPGPPLPLPRRFNVLFICTFKRDEPYRAVLEAARTLGSDIGIYVTGDPPDEIRAATWSDNVVFCGRLPWDRYDQLLRSVNGIVDLTTREWCLLCGAYEGVAAGKPLILSQTTTLMSYFTRGAVFTDNTTDCSPHSIRAAILEARSREPELCQEVKRLRGDLLQDWEVRKRKVLALL